MTHLLINEHGLNLHKGAFRDALALRYGWQPADIPAERFYGKAFSVQHALSCHKGRFPTLHHNEVRNLRTSLLMEVCSNVVVEPGLQAVESRGTIWGICQQLGTRELKWTWLQMVWGAREGREPSSTFGSSTHMPPPTNCHHYQERTRNINRRKMPVSSTHS